MSKIKLPKRDEVALKDTWDLTPIFESEQQWEEEFSELSQEIDKAKDFKGTLGESAEKLYAALSFRDQLFQRLNRLYVYSHLQEDTDTRNAEYQSLNARAVSIITKGAAEFSFFSSEIMAQDEQRIKGFLQQKKELKIYQHEFDELFLRRQHILSQKEESLLAKVSEPLDNPSKTFAILNNADLKFPSIENEKGEKTRISHGTYIKFLESTDRRVRRDAYQGLHKTYGELKNTFASTLSGTVKTHNFAADIRGFESARQKSLFDNNIPETVYDALVDAVNSRIDLLHRYVELRQKVLELDEISMYDMYTPMVADVELKFSYEQAKDLVLEGLGVLGEDYCSVLERAFGQRWIDRIENKGKRSGAYSSGTYGTNPYILMNWQDTLDNIFTLAHELGHSVHSYYSRSTQPYIYSSYSIFLAEIASTTNENLLTEYLLKKYDDPAMRAYIINHYLDGVKGTVFRQTQFAEFEHIIHSSDQQGIPLTAEYLCEQYDKINRKYYGKAVSYDDEIAMEWARIPHFYYDYYVYQYATGFSAASYFSRSILEQGEPALIRYLDFLKAGSSDYPIEVLKKAGLDMTGNQAVMDTLDIFEQRLSELEELLIK